MGPLEIVSCLHNRGGGLNKNRKLESWTKEIRLVKAKNKIIQLSESLVQSPRPSLSQVKFYNMDKSNLGSTQINIFRPELCFQPTPSPKAVTTDFLAWK